MEKTILYVLLFLASTLIFSLSSCSTAEEPDPTAIAPEIPIVDEILNQEVPNQPYLVILGIAQDAGYPQAGCKKECCNHYWHGTTAPEEPVAIGMVDPATNQSWLIEATPDIKHQLYQLEQTSKSTLSGIFLTHAHIGHYTGLMHFGREVMGASETPVYVMPRMKSFLSNNGPWDQLVKLKNISLVSLQNDSSIQLTSTLSITPFTVPHRDEYSETVGYQIKGPEKSVVFIPDIDKWNRWEQDIKTVVRNNDIAFLDATFFANGEIPGRNMDEIPHPFVEETMEVFKASPDSIKNRISLIHFNHTNPLLHNDSIRQVVLRNGFRIAADGHIIEL